MIVEFYHSNLIFGIAFIMFGGAGFMIISWVAITLCVNCKRPPANIDEERNIQNVGQHRQEETKVFQVHVPSIKPVTSKSYGRQDHPDHLNEIKNEQVESKCREKSDGLSKDCSFEQSKSLVPVNKSEIESQKVMIKIEQVVNKCTSKSNNREGTKQVGQGKSQGFKSKDGMVLNVDLLKQECQAQSLDGPELKPHDNKSNNEEQREPKKQQPKGKKHKRKRNKNSDQVGLKKDSSVVPHFTNQCESQLDMKPVKDLFDVECMKNQEQGENAEEVLQHKRKNEEEDEGSHKKKKKDTSPPKLENLGNTCYFNSALQALYQTHILGHLLKKLKKQCSEKGCPLLQSMCPLLQSMLNFYFGNRTPNPQEILKNVRQSSNRFLGYKQEDSHELIRHLCQGLVKEEKKLSQDSPTVIDKVFRGHVLRLYYCLKCLKVYHLVEQFYDLSLPISFPLDDLSDNINDDFGGMTESKSPLVPLLTRKIPERRGRPESDHAGRTKSVEACLKYHTRRDTISYFCQCFGGDPELDDLPIACDRSLLIDLPPVLVIHLQRFEQSQYGRFVKCGVPVIYPKVLDLAPYTIQYDESGNTENLYDLYGVVEHSGTMDFGHYIACIKTRKDTTERLEDFIKSRNFKKDDVTQDWIINEIKKFGESTNTTTLTKDLQEKDNQWYYTSDSYKKKINEDEALGREAILLFYEKL